MDILGKKTHKLSKLCRLCLAEDGLMVHLHGEERYGHKISLSERILCCTTVEIKEGDGLPFFVCHRCVYRVDTLFEFRIRCQRVDAALRIFCNEFKLNGDCEDEVFQDRNQTSPVVCEALPDAELFVKEEKDSYKKVNGTSEINEAPSESVVDSDMSSKDTMGPSNKPYHCPHCNKPFTYKARLAAHIKTHGDNQMFQGDAMLQIQQQPVHQQPPQHLPVPPQAQTMHLPQLSPHSVPSQPNHYSGQQHQMQYGMQQQYTCQQPPLQQHVQSHLLQQQPPPQMQQQIMQQQLIQQQQSMQQQPMQQQPMQQQSMQQQPMQQQSMQQQSMQQQSMQQQSIQQQSMQQQSMQQQALQQQSMQQQSLQQSMQSMHQQQTMQSQSYDTRMYDMNYRCMTPGTPTMPETPGTPPSNSSDSTFSCSSCSATFMTPWLLADHVRSRCCDPNVSYNCDKCYSQFGSYSDLEQHKLSRSCENQVPSYYDAYTPPPSHYGMYAQHQQHQQDFSSTSDMMDSRNSPSPWNMMAARSPGSVANSGNSRPRIQRQESYCGQTRSPQLGTMEELEKFAMSNTVVTSPLEPLASPGLTEPLPSAPSPLDPENSVQSVQSVQSTQSTHSSGSGSCGPRSSINFNTSSSVRFGGPNFCGGNVSSNFGVGSNNPSFPGNFNQGFGSVGQSFGNIPSNQNFGSSLNTGGMNPNYGNLNQGFSTNANHNIVPHSATSFSGHSGNFQTNPNPNFGNRNVNSEFGDKPNLNFSQTQNPRVEEVNANTKFCDDMNVLNFNQNLSLSVERTSSPVLTSQEAEEKASLEIDESLNASDSGTGMLLTTSPGSSRGCIGNSDNPYSCQVCKASFASRTLFTNHMKTHAPDRSVKCNLCSNSFPSNTALRSHIDSVHSESGSEKSLHIVLDDSQSPEKLEENVNSEDSDDEPLSKLVKPVTPAPKKRGRKPKAATEAENGDKSHECLYCGKGFVSAVRLSVHTKLHTAEKPYKCDQCDKAFRSRAHLQRHVKTHAGDKPFKCETCNKSFTVSMNLKIHMRTHTGERPYQCNLCQMAFIGYSHLYNHLKTHTDTQGPFTYTYFNKVYTTTGNFSTTKREKTARGRNREKEEDTEKKEKDDKDKLKETGKSAREDKKARRIPDSEGEEEDDEDEEDNDASDDLGDLK